MRALLTASSAAPPCRGPRPVAVAVAVSDLDGLPGEQSQSPTNFSGPTLKCYRRPPRSGAPCGALTRSGATRVGTRPGAGCGRARQGRRESERVAMGASMRSWSAPSFDPRVSQMSPEPPVVFVVDDDVSIRESLEALIRHAGWRTETFESAQEFLARPRVVAPSCLVLDVSLPDLNGLDLQKRIADRSDMPIIFITGYGDVPMTVQAMKAGAVEFLMKPFSDETLLSAIRQAIDLSRAALD